jgi:hypothetical protein
MFRLLFVLISSSMFLASCASSSPDEESGDAMSQDDARQKELDEIEALLGVERPAEDKSAKDEDTLGLLSSEDVPVKGQSTGVQNTPPPPPPNSTTELELQLVQKDALISDLKRQVKNQNIQISQLEAAKSSASVNVYQGVSGDIPAGEYEQRYQDGFNLFQSRNYKSAIEVFEALIASSSSHSLSDRRFRNCVPYHLHLCGIFFTNGSPFGRIVKTGQGAWRTTFSATLPIRACERPVLPWVAMTIRSASLSVAASIIFSAAGPTSTRVCVSILWPKSDWRQL